MKKVAVVTGTRAEYGILHPVLKAVEANKGLRLYLIVTGMHLSHDFGYTVSEIERDGFKIEARVPMLADTDTATAMAESVGRGIIGLSQVWSRLSPDFIVVLGDRVEPLAAAFAGVYMNIPVAHIHGGDVTGGFDEYARHAITKIAHVHFPATARSAARIIKMGEDEWRVHMVGSPALDTILNEPLLSPATTASKLSLDTSKLLLMVAQHPVTTEAGMAPVQMKETLEAVVETGNPAIVFYPNSDAGGRSMIELIKQYVKKFPYIKAIPNLPRREYLSLMKISGVLVGNSSSGIIDAPSFGLPAVNIGIRQEGRERGCNVIDVLPDRREIVKGIQKALNDKNFIKQVKKCENPYGDGKAGVRIAEILAGIEKTPRLLEKKLTY
jgi:GDP/UDP-N,N'-diacetylbacillosamine 2-epimerase (hydrolysing)